MKSIRIKYHNKNIDPVEKIKVGDWIDLRAAEDTVLKAGEFKLVSLGVSMKLPRGYEAHIVPRSSTYKTFKILQTNSMGIIDESYCGNGDVWKFPVLAIEDTHISEGDRICQFRIMKKMPKVKFKVVDELHSENRGGFGSTGKT